MYNNREYIPVYVTAGSTAQIFAGKGILHAIIVGTTAATPVVFYGGTTASGSTTVLLKSSIVEGTYPIDAVIPNGLYMTYGAAGTYTVLYTK